MVLSQTLQTIKGQNRCLQTTDCVRAKQDEMRVRMDVRRHTRSQNATLLAHERKLRHREGKGLAQDHTASKVWIKESNRVCGLQSLKLTVLPPLPSAPGKALSLQMGPKAKPPGCCKNRQSLQLEQS